MNPIQQNWSNFKTDFRTDHRNLKETFRLSMEDVGYHQANLLNYTVSHMSGLSFTYPTQGYQDIVYAPTITPIPNYAPTIAPIIQPSPEANAITDATSNIIPQLITSIQHTQQLTLQMQGNQSG